MARQPGQETENAAQPDSLLSDIARTQPWLRTRVRGLRICYRQLRDAVAALQDELDAAAAEAADFADIRQRLAPGARRAAAPAGPRVRPDLQGLHDAFGSDIPRDAADQLPGR